MTKSELAARYTDFLTDQGFRPEIDKDGDVKFLFEGGLYYILVSEKDPEFFRLVYPNFWEIESDEEKMKATIAASFATADTKVAKVILVGNNVWASVESFFESPDHFKGVFRRSISAIRTAVSSFRDNMKQLSGV
ncbi:MAG TPA: hypothetical protein PLS81_04775 [Deltaproteobacteria bacterium]|nr:hypothetical protein [Deltaproteobacteria bacterium]HOM28751.1 hypothetical protein [Deltaproteobacteria bacterium]HPP81464.1 hypothetical protein [Deltaproteobacteria bacterium]